MGPDGQERLGRLGRQDHKLDLQELPYAAPARWTASYRLVPVSQMKGRYSPVDREWDLKLTLTR